MSRGRTRIVSRGRTRKNTELVCGGSDWRAKHRPTRLGPHRSEQLMPGLLCSAPRKRTDHEPRKNTDREPRKNTEEHGIGLRWVGLARQAPAYALRHAPFRAIDAGPPLQCAAEAHGS